MAGEHDEEIIAEILGEGSFVAASLKATGPQVSARYDWLTHFEGVRGQHLIAGNVLA